MMGVREAQELPKIAVQKALTAAERRRLGLREQDEVSCEALVGVFNFR